MGMEDVLAAHYDVELEHGYWSCICGEEFGVLLPDELHRAHVAEALAAAGFGNLHDAWAEGRKSALNKLSNDSANPYPKVSET